MGNERGVGRPEGAIYSSSQLIRGRAGGLASASAPGPAVSFDFQEIEELEDRQILGKYLHLEGELKSLQATEE